MITIKDMAYKAGVSPTTISNVLNGRTGKLSKETLVRVQKVINESNYVSNMGARLLANNGSRILGVIIMYGRRDEQIATQDPFYSEIIGSLEHEIRQIGYYMMLYTSGSIEESLKLAKAWNTEGLIVLGASSQDCRLFKENTGIPIVFIDSYVEGDGIQYANVGLQDREGAYQMTSYLIKNGHKNIAFLADSLYPVGVDKERLEGYKQALIDHGIIGRDRFLSFDYKIKERHDFLKDFIKNQIKEFTALFFSSDYYAVDSIRFLLDHNIRIPEDISVAGFDDNIFSTLCRPLLTTVHQDVSDKAKYSVKLLLSTINKEVTAESMIHLPIHLVIRESVREINTVLN
jgi:LacI family transcriptional regulator